MNMDEDSPRNSMPKAEEDAKESEINKMQASEDLLEDTPVKPQITEVIIINGQVNNVTDKLATAELKATEDESTANNNDNEKSSKNDLISTEKMTVDAESTNSQLTDEAKINENDELPMEITARPGITEVVNTVNNETNELVTAELMNVETKSPNASNCQEQNLTKVSENDDIIQQPSKNVISAGLTMLAQYDSDGGNESDAESVIEIFSNVNDYRNQVTELSSDSESSSSSSTSSSSHSSNVEGEKGRLKNLRKVIDKSIAATAGTDDEDDDDEVDENGVKKTKRRLPPKVKGELLLDDLPPIEDLHITVPEDECKELGKVHSIVDQLLLVSVLPNSLLLDLETVLFLDKGKRVLGAVFDVLGPVSAPLYCIRFNSNAQIHEKHISVGDLVYVAPKTQYTQFVILSSLMKIRGSDASWENDVEPPQRYLDYSDDEQERQARARLRNKNRQEPSEHDDQPKRIYQPHQAHDNETEEDDISDTMSVTSESTVASEQSDRGHGRGRGRRSRGNRGRGMPSFNPRPMAPQMQGGYPHPDNSSWHSNYYPSQPYGYQPYGGMPPPPPPPAMGYYQYVPPYAYGPNYMPYPPPHVQQMQMQTQQQPPMPPPTKRQEHNQ